MLISIQHQHSSEEKRNDFLIQIKEKLNIIILTSVLKTYISFFCYVTAIKLLNFNYHVLLSLAQTYIFTQIWFKEQAVFSISLIHVYLQFFTLLYFMMFFLVWNFLNLKRCFLGKFHAWLFWLKSDWINGTARNFTCFLDVIRMGVLKIFSGHFFPIFKVDCYGNWR